MKDICFKIFLFGLILMNCSIDNSKKELLKNRNPIVRKTIEKDIRHDSLLVSDTLINLFQDEFNYHDDVVKLNIASASVKLNKPYSNIKDVFSLLGGSLINSDFKNSQFKIISDEKNNIKLICTYKGFKYSLNLFNFSNNYFVFNYEKSRFIIDKTHNLLFLVGQYSWGGSEIKPKNAVTFSLLDNNLRPYFSIKRKTINPSETVMEYYIYNTEGVKAYSVDLPKKFSKIAFDNYTIYDLLEVKNYIHSNTINPKDELDLLNPEYFENNPIWAEFTLFEPLQSLFK